MEPFGEVSRDCGISISQDDSLRRSVFYGDLQDSSGGEEEAYSASILICSPPCDSDGEDTSTNDESPTADRQMLPETLNDPKELANAAAGEDDEDDEDEDDDKATAERFILSKRKSTVAIELESSSGSKTKKTRFSITEPQDLGLLSLEGDSSTKSVESLNASLDLGSSKTNSKVKSSVEKDLGFFERIKSRFFTGKYPDLRLPAPDGDSSALRRIADRDIAADAPSAPRDNVGEIPGRDITDLGLEERSAKRICASEGKSPIAKKDLGFSASRGHSSGKPIALESIQGANDMATADASTSKGKFPVDENLPFLTGDSSGKPTAVELLQGVDNDCDIDPTVTEGKSPGDGVSFGKFTPQEQPQRIIDSGNKIADVSNANVVCSKGKSISDTNARFSNSKGESSSPFVAEDNENFQISTNAAPAEVIVGISRSLSGKRNVSPSKGNSLAERNLGFSKSPEKLPARSPAKDQPPNPANRISELEKDALTNPLSKHAHEGPELENIPSDMHGGGRKDSSGKDAVPLVNVLANSGYSYPSLELFKEAFRINKMTSINAPVPRKLPPSIQGPVEKVAAAPDLGRELTKMLHVSPVQDLLEMVNSISKASDHSVGNENILEVAKRAGYVFPRPQWWRPEGYSKC